MGRRRRMAGRVVNLMIPDALWRKVEANALKRGLNPPRVAVEAIERLAADDFVRTEIVEKQVIVTELVPAGMNLSVDRVQLIRTHVTHLIKNGFTDQEISAWVRVGPRLVQEYRRILAPEMEI